jgi:hypothetical protein
MFLYHLRIEAEVEVVEMVSIYTFQEQNFWSNFFLWQTCVLSAPWADSIGSVCLN